MRFYFWSQKWLLSSFIFWPISDRQNFENFSEKIDQNKPPEIFLSNGGFFGVFFGILFWRLFFSEQLPTHFLYENIEGTWAKQLSRYLILITKSVLTGLFVGGSTINKLLCRYQTFRPSVLLKIFQLNEPSPRTFDETDTFSVAALKQITPCSFSRSELTLLNSVKFLFFLVW